MREIKFRAWADQNKKLWPPSMVYWYPVEPPEKYNDGRMNLNNYAWSGHNLMQYTGLKDKNGKEIYEGDIFQIGNDIFKVPDPVGFGIKIATGYNFAIGEVIGNIYENKELLK